MSGKMYSPVLLFTFALMLVLAFPMLALADEGAVASSPDEAAKQAAVEAAKQAEAEAAAKAAAEAAEQAAASAPPATATSPEAPAVTVRYETDPDEGATFGTNLRYLFWKDSGMLVIEKVDADEDAWFDGEDFENREDIKSVYIGEGIDLSSNWTFYDCSAIESVHLPASLSQITFHVFEGCANLKDVYYAGTIEQWDAVEIRDGNDPLGQAVIHCSDGDTTVSIPERMDVSISDIKSMKFYSPRPIFAGFDNLSMGIAADATMNDGTVYYLDFGYEYEYNYDEPYGGLYQLNDLIWGLGETESLSIDLASGSIDVPGKAQAKITLNGDLANIPYNSTVAVQVVDNPVTSLSFEGDSTMTYTTGEIEHENYDEEALAARRDVVVHYRDGSTRTFDDILEENSDGWSGWAWDDGSCSDFIMDTKVSGEDFNQALKRHGSERHRIEYSMKQALADMTVGQSYPVTIKYMGCELTGYVKIVEGEYVEPDNPGDPDDPEEPTPDPVEPVQLEKVTAPSGSMLTYNGSTQTGVAAGTGYTLSGTYSAKNAGSYTVTATPRAGYCWQDGSTSSRSITWSIGTLSLSGATVTLSATNSAYSGNAFKPSVSSVKVGGITVPAGDYSVSYSSGCVNAGSYSVTVSAKGSNTTGSASAGFTVSKASLSGAKVTASTQTITKLGAVTPAVTVVVSGRTLKSGTDFTASFANNTAPGSAKITVTGKGNYTGTATGSFTIKGATSTERPKGMKTLANLKSAGKLGYSSGTGWATNEGIKVPGMVSTYTDLSGIKLTANDNTSCFCSHMTPQGICVAKNYLLITAYCCPVDKSTKKHTSVIYVMDKSTGALKTTIALRDGTKSFTNHVGGITYDGTKYVYIATSGIVKSSRLTELRVPYETIDALAKSGGSSLDISGCYVTLGGSNSADKASFNTYYGGYLWVGFFYDPDSKDNTKATTKYGYVNGYKVSGNTYTKKVELKICNKANGATFFSAYGRNYLIVNQSFGRTTDSNQCIYTVQNIQKSADLTKSAFKFSSAKVLPLMEEFCISDKTLYTLSESCSSYFRTSAKTTPTDIVFRGSFANLVSGRKDISSASVSKISDVTYNGSAFKPSPTVSVGKISGIGTGNLVKGSDYALSYSNNTKVGTAKVTIKGTGIFKGSITKTFKIKKASIKKAKLTVGNVTYNGKVQKPTVKVVVGGRTLKSGTDYSASYKNNTKAGTATVTVTGKGGYDGSAKTTFKINKASNSMTASSTMCPTFKAKDLKKKKQTKSSSISVKKAQGKVTYKKTSGSGKISVDKNTGKITVAKGTGKATYTIKTQVTAAGDANHKSKSVTVTETIRVS